MDGVLVRTVVTKRSEAGTVSFVNVDIFSANDILWLKFLTQEFIEFLLYNLSFDLIDNLDVLCNLGFSCIFFGGVFSNSLVCIFLDVGDRPLEQIMLNFPVHFILFMRKRL